MLRLTEHAVHGGDSPRQNGFILGFMGVWTWRGIFGSGQPATMKAEAKCCAAAAGPTLLRMSVRSSLHLTIQTTATIPMGFDAWVGRCREGELGVSRK